MPALINVIVPAGTLLGWSNAPADVGSWGLMDADTVRDLIEAASRHPRTRWCYTITGQDGEAIAHACARGSHPWTPPPPSRDGPSRDGPADQRPDAARRAPARAERRPRADRQGNLRPRPPRGPLHPQPQAQAPRPRPHRTLPRARLRRPGHHRRDRPHHPVPGRGNLRAQPQPPVRSDTTTPSTHPAGNSSRPSPASCAGPRPRAAPTPPAPPSTKNNHRNWQEPAIAASGAAAGGTARTAPTGCRVIASPGSARSPGNR